MYTYVDMVDVLVSMGNYQNGNIYGNMIELGLQKYYFSFSVIISTIHGHINATQRTNK